MLKRSAGVREARERLTRLVPRSHRTVSGATAKFEFPRPDVGTTVWVCLDNYGDDGGGGGAQAAAAGGAGGKQWRQATVLALDEDAVCVTLDEVEAEEDEDDGGWARGGAHWVPLGSVSFLGIWDLLKLLHTCLEFKVRACVCVAHVGHPP